MAGAFAGPRCKPPSSHTQGRAHTLCAAPSPHRTHTARTVHSKQRPRYHARARVCRESHTAKARARRVLHRQRAPHGSTQCKTRQLKTPLLLLRPRVYITAAAAAAAHSTASAHALSNTARWHRQPSACPRRTQARAHGCTCLNHCSWPAQAAAALTTRRASSQLQQHIMPAHANA